MKNTKGSANKKPRPANKEDESSSSSNTPKNENPVEEMINLNRMFEDAGVLFSHFPEEIWKLITDKYLDSESLANLTLTSAVFRNLLLPRRVEFLFPQMWKVLGVKFEKREDEEYSYNFDEMFPGGDLSKFPDGKTPWCSRILTLRLVCKSWCEGVDKFYEKFTSTDRYKMWDDRSEHHLRGIGMAEWTHTARTSYSNPSWKSFINHFDPTHFDADKNRNPIIGRQIYIEEAVGRGKGVLELLSKYGHHFWCCELDLVVGFETGVDSVACYTHLKEILKLLPNLKTLSVQYQCMADKDELEQLIAQHRLPKLHRLEFLSVGQVPDCIFNALVSVNDHISMLEVTIGDEYGGYDIYSFPMPNLKQLSMHYYLETDFENLINQEVNWALEKFYLRFYSNPLVSRSQIFSLLENKWATTLTNVAITLPPTYSQDSLNAEAMNDDLSLRLNLPSVQRFRVESLRIFSLDFILPMRSLEFLEVALCKIEPSEIVEKRLRLLEKNQVVQFVGYYGRLHESNIWNLFPNLKSIQFFEANSRWSSTLLDVCTREDFERKEKTSAAQGPSTRSGKNILWVYSST